MLIVAPTTIALREGIEAALIIAIILSYLRKSNRFDLKKYVIGGVVLAIASSIGIAMIMAFIWGVVEGSVLAIFEGVVVLIAAFLLTTMILWMWKTDSDISSEIESSAAKRLGLQGGFGLALLSFAMILREGVELVLFSIALAIQDAFQTYIGVALGLTIAVIMGIGIYKGSLKISLRAFFGWTSTFLVFVAAGMIAYGIHELQEAGLLLIGSIEIWNVNPPLLPDGSFPLLHENGIIGGFAKALFGYNGNPSSLEVIAYISFLFAILIIYIRSSFRVNQEIESKLSLEENVVVQQNKGDD